MRLLYCSIAALFTSLALATPTSATPLPNTITEDMTLTEADSPYTASGNVTITPSAEVTVEAGVTIKATGKFYVDGGLIVQGSASKPVTFTSTQDSAPGQWGGVYYRTGSTGSINNAEFRYGGKSINGMVQTDVSIEVTNSTFKSSYTSGIFIAGGQPTITNSTFYANNYGIYVYGPGSPSITDNTISLNTVYGILYHGSALAMSGPIEVKSNTVTSNGSDGFRYLGSIFGFQGGDVSGNTFKDNGGRALYFDGIALAANNPLPKNISQNTATGNGCDCVWLFNVSITEPTSWKPPGLTFVLSGQLEVTSTLSLEEGLVIKSTNTHASRIVVSKGTLNVDGATLTSYADDSKAGDTNKDGQLTFPQPGDWGGITTYQSGQATISDAKISYAGSYKCCGIGNQAFVMYGPSDNPPTLKNSKVRHTGTSALWVDDFEGNNPQVTHNSFSDIKGFAIDKSHEVKDGKDFLLDAPNNSFGCDSGPYPAGCGAKVGTYVNAKPYGIEGQEDGSCIGTDTQCGQGADPVTLATGAFTHTHTDLSLKGIGPKLSFSRFYNSSDTSDTGLGKDWSHSGLMQATTLENGDVIIRREDGRRDTFKKEDESFVAPSGVVDSLTKNEDQTYTLKTPEQTTYNFDKSGRIKEISDDHQNTLTYSYDANARLTSIEDEAGQSLSFTYNATNHITKVTDSASREVTYSYDDKGHLKNVTDPLSAVSTYSYDSDGRITEIEDPTDTTYVKNSYDQEGRVTEQKDGLDNLWQLAYEESQTQVSDPEGGIKTYNFDNDKRLSSKEDELGNVTSLSYNGQGLINEITRPGSSTSTFSYDGNGNLTSTTDPLSAERSFTYNGKNQLTSLEDANSNTWDFTWSDGNDLVEIEDPKNHSTTLTYTGKGLPETISDAKDNTRSFGYDSRGNIIKLTDPKGKETTYAYNDYNYLTSILEPAKTNPTTFLSNALGDLLSTTDPEGSTTTFTYNENGELTELNDPDGNSWQIERNAIDKPTAYIDPTGKSIEFTYDANQNPIAIEDRLGKITTYEYDKANRPTKATLPSGATFSYAYDERGNLVTSTDPKGNVTTYSHDTKDRLTSVNGPLKTKATYSYDAEDNPTSYTDPRNKLTSLTYDELNQLTKLTQPGGKETSFSYDEVGNISSRATAVSTLNFFYDELDLLTKIESGDITLRSFAYDDNARISSATDKDGETITLSYDDADRLTKFKEGGDTATRSYDSRGNLTSQTDERGTITYTYDALSRLTSLEDPQGQEISFSYDDEGQLTNQSLPNGIVQAITYNPDGKIEKTEAKKDAALVDSYSYTFDANGNTTQRKDNRTSKKTTYYYDALDRLTKERRKEKTTSYTYDRAGNRTKAGTLLFTYNNINQLIRSSDGKRHSYDKAGRLTKKKDGTKTTTYSWDPLDQLTSTTLPNKSKTTQSYDALGRVKGITKPEGKKTIHYGDLSDFAIFEKGEDGNLTQSYLTGPFGLVESWGAEDTSYPLSDAHGDITAITDASGSATSYQSHDAWGNQISGAPQTYGYLGAFQRMSDSDTSLIQMGSRPYSPDIGRFISEDPVLGYTNVPQSLNRYAYALDNPIRYLDLDGRSVFGDIGDMLEESGDWWSDTFNDFSETDVYRRGLAPAGNTLYNFLPHRWGNLRDDWRDGLDELPRGLRALDKALVEWGPMFLPYGAVSKAPKVLKFLFTKEGKVVSKYNPLKGAKYTRPVQSQFEQSIKNEWAKESFIRYGSRETRKKRAIADGLLEILKNLKHH